MLKVKNPLGRKQLRSMFEKNFEILAQRWPHVAEMVKKAKSKFKIEAILGEEGKPPNLVVKTPDGKKIFFHSPDLDAEIKSILNRPDLRHPQFVIFLGLGLGFYPLFMLKEKFKTLRLMLIVEKDPAVLKWAMSLVDLRPILSFPGTELMVGIPEEKLFAHLRKYIEAGVVKYFVKTVKVVPHEPSLFLYKDYYNRFMHCLRDAAREAILFFGNDPQDSLIGLDNIIKNLKVIASNPGIKELFGKFQGRPAVCVASGPSLKKNIHLLKNIQDRALIFCCDATLKILLKHGIYPHFVTSLERVPQVVKFFEGIPAEELTNTWLAACPVVVPEVYKTYQGPKVIVYRAFAHFDWIGIDRGMLRIGPSCANMSFKIAEALGCNPIILVGQDLAYGEEGESHIDGHPFRSDRKDFKNVIWVEGNYKEKVPTSRAWYTFLKHFELDVAEFNGICINATEGGAKIPGTKIMRLKDAIEAYIKEPFNPVEIIRAHLKPPKKEEIERDMEKLRERIKETKEFVDHVISEYKEVLEEIVKYKNETLKEILKRTEDFLSEEEIRKTKELSSKIRKTKEQTLRHELFYLYLMHIVQSYIIKSEIEFASILDKYKNTDFAEVEFVARHEEWFRVMINLIELCNRRLDWAREILEG